MCPQYALIVKMSIFTLKLLNSTGWYIVNGSMEEITYWGKNKGCSFFNDKCKSGQNFREFCNNYGCGIGYKTISTCLKSEYLDKCNVRFPFTYKGERIECTNPFTKSIQRLPGYNFTYDSFCLTTTFNKIFNNMGVSPGCYSGGCSKNPLTGKWQFNVTINNKNFKFMQDIDDLKAKRIIINFKIGYVYVPNIKEFCEIMNERCENDCYNFGICLKENKTCYYTHFMNFLGLCAPNKYLIVNNYNGYHLDCDECLDGDKQIRVGLNDGSGLCLCNPFSKEKFKCINCPQGSYYDIPMKKCLKCVQNCEICISKNKCESCNKDFYKIGNSCVKCDQEGETKIGPNWGDGICLNCLKSCIMCKNENCYCFKNLYQLEIKNKSKICSDCNMKHYSKIGSNDGSGKCIINPTINCKILNADSTKCLVCKKNYFFAKIGENQTKICIDCSEAGFDKDENSKHCDKKCHYLEFCENCKKGFLLNPVTKYCMGIFFFIFKN